MSKCGLYKFHNARVAPSFCTAICAYLKDNGSSGVERIVIDGGTLVKITNQDDSTVTLNGVKSVEFLKEDDEPSVRVTYDGGSTVTYENSKKVEFGK